MSKEMTRKPRIAVLGSVHMDLIARAERLPDAGESIGGTGFAMAPGGKGGNQAAQCAALGAEAFMITQFGDDLFGRELLASLKAKGVDTSMVSTSASAATGASTVFATPDDYSSIIYPGAAAGLTVDEITRCIAALAPLDMLLLQLEIPLALSLAAAKAARDAGARVVLNPSPAPQHGTADALVALTSILVVNRVEAGLILGSAVEDRDIEAAARALGNLGPPLVVITLGREGSAAWDGADFHRQPVFPIAVADTVGAGDAFLGTLCVALAEGRPLAETLRRASAAGAIAASRTGAQATTMADVDAFLLTPARP
jgi:ribokinase